MTTAALRASARTHDVLADVLRERSVVSHFQPIVDLESRGTVGFEALARGPEGPLHTPMALFGAARAEGMLPALDLACRRAALDGARRHGLVSPVTLFVNVEPEALDGADVEDLAREQEEMAGAGRRLDVVIEITERALTSRPAQLLRSLERFRDLGWGIALDDVGADSASLAFMALLRPDVVKLDLSLVQRRPTPAVAEIMNAVNAYAQETGALVLAEGIETETHLETARALGATLGQGWLFGRPTAAPTPPATPPRRLGLPERARAVVTPGEGVSALAVLPLGTSLRTAPKRLLLELTKHLEGEARRIGETAVVVASLQHGDFFTARTRSRYEALATRAGYVCLLGEGLPAQPVPGVRGVDLAAGDPVRDEWDVVVLSPYFSVALLARDLGDAGPDLERRFAFSLTYDRDVVIAAARALLVR